MNKYYVPLIACVCFLGEYYLAYSNSIKSEITSRISFESQAIKSLNECTLKEDLECIKASQALLNSYTKIRLEYLINNDLSIKFSNNVSQYNAWLVDQPTAFNKSRQ